MLSLKNVRFKMLLRGICIVFRFFIFYQPSLEVDGLSLITLSFLDGETVAHTSYQLKGVTLL